MSRLEINMSHRSHYRRSLPVLGVAIALFAVWSAGCGDDTAPANEEDASSERVITGDPLTPRFDLGADDFYRMPWPSDYRTEADGRLILDDFPRVGTALLDTYINGIVEEVRGFATMPVIFVNFDQHPGVESFPRPTETLSVDSPVQLFDVSTEGCGTRVPIDVRFETDGDDYRDPNTLIAAPLPGYALHPARPYALVVLRTFGNQNGFQAIQPAEFEGVIEGDHTDADLVNAYAPLGLCLEGAGLTPEDIAVATVFTTQETTDELRLVRAVVIDPEQTQTPVIRDWELSEEATREARYRTYTGIYDTPMYQRGTTPYTVAGGGMRFDESGEPIFQRWEAVRMAVTYPTQGQPPYPLIIWMDGTGADLLSHVTGKPVRDAINAGFAVATFLPQFHGDRSGPAANPELHTFNFTNPEAFRSNLRQQVVDVAYYIRVVREALDGLEGHVALDTDTLLYGGHSQGAIVGAIVAGVETEFDAYMLNGVGAYLSITAVEREDPIDINQLIRNLLGIPGILDRFHPVIALIQTGGEASDPINYARYWRGWPGHESGNSLFLINGQLDHTTPETSINAMTIAGDVTPIADPGWNVDPYGLTGLTPLTLPIQGNSTALDGSPLTIATYLSNSTGHFTIYDLRDPRVMAIQFWVSALAGLPVLDLD